MFRDPELQTVFDRQGFVLVRLLERDAALELGERLEAVRKNASGQSCTVVLDQSFCTTDADFRLQAHEIAAAAVAPRLDEVLTGYRLLGAGLMTKPAGAGTMAIHRDRDILANRAQTAVATWCPLVDVDDEHGGLAVLPGSNRLPNIDSDDLPGFYVPYAEALKTLCLSPPLSAGEAILFDNSLLHGSWPNLSGVDRPVVRATSIPQGERAVFYRLDPASGGARFEIVDAEWGEHGAMTHAPDAMSVADFEAPVVGHAPNTNRPVSFRECRDCVAAAMDTPPRTLLQRIGALVR